MTVERNNDHWSRGFASARVFALLAAAFAVGLSFGAAVVNLVVKLAESDVMQGTAFLGFAAWIAVLGCVLPRVHRIRHHNAFVWGLSVGVFLIRLVWIGLHTAYPQLADQEIFLRFVRLLRESQFSAESLVALSASYDYYIWVSRGFPFPHLLAWWFPHHDVLALQIANAIFLSLTLWLLDQVAEPMMPPAARRLALLLFASIPLQFWQLLEFGHHLFSTLLLLLCIHVARRIAEGASAAGMLFGALLLGGLQFLLALQVGVDQLGMAFILFTMLAFTPWRQPLIRSFGRLFLLLAIVCAVWLPAKRGYFQWQASYDTHRLSSGVAGFMARGYSMEKWGEYDSHWEQIDKITPASEGVAAMAAVPLFRAAAQPWVTFGMLLPIKTAKYGLIGYATTAEAALEQMGRPMERAWFRAARLLFAPVFLGAVLLGIFHLLSEVVAQGARRLLPIFLCLTGYAIFTLLGETSPRYSVYVQPFLALLAGCGLEAILRSRSLRPIAGGVVLGLKRLPSIVALYALLGGLTWAAARCVPPHLLYVPFDPERSDLPVPFEPLFASLNDGQTAVLAHPVQGRVVFHAWPPAGGAIGAGSLQVWAGEDVVFERSLCSIHRLERWVFDVPRPERLAFHVTGGSVSRVGYVRQVR